MKGSGSSLGPRTMRRLRYRRIDVFTNRPFGGNPLAVFTDGDGLSPKTMQSIARELNLSETTFVMSPADPSHDHRVRIFTPAIELPMAGHPTIGTSFVLAMDRLAERSERVTGLELEEGVGPISIGIEWEGDRPGFIEMQQPLPRFGPRFTDTGAIAEMLSLEATALTDTELPLEVVSCGVPFLFVPVRNLQAIRSIRFRLDIWERVLRT